MQGAQVQLLVRKLDPTCCSQSSHAAAKIWCWCREINLQRLKKRNKEESAQDSRLLREAGKCSEEARRAIFTFPRVL